MRILVDYSPAHGRPVYNLSQQEPLMELHGTVSGGVVVPEPGVELPEGARVRMEVVESKQRSLGERLMKFAGRAKGLPSDMAANHDHYLHGQPKRT